MSGEDKVNLTDGEPDDYLPGENNSIGRRRGCVRAVGRVPCFSRKEKENGNVESVLGECYFSDSGLPALEQRDGPIVA